MRSVKLKTTKGEIVRPVSRLCSLEILANLDLDSGVNENIENIEPIIEESLPDSYKTRSGRVIKPLVRY